MHEDIYFSGMKTIGLIGGLSWVSTLDYYKHLNMLVNERLGGDEAAKIQMVSVNFGEIKKRTLEDDWAGITTIIGQAAQTLEKGGSDCVLIGANTMHRIAPEVQAMVNIPVLHIAEATAAAIQAKGLHKILLLGTKYTMAMESYKDILKKQGIETIIPDASGIEMVNEAIYKEMGKGLFLPETKENFIRLIEKMSNQGAEGVILGCTEIPQLLQQKDLEIPLFDTAYLHAKAAVDFALKTT